MSFFDKFLTRDRQKKLKRRYMHKIMLFLSKSINMTCRNRFHITAHVKDNNFIACLWHGNFLMMPYLYAKAREIPNMCLITAAHNDGAMVEQYFEEFGLHSIRGSTGAHKGGTRVLMQAVRALKDGKDVAVTPDGPKGPYKSIANGILLMAMRSGVGICGCKVQPSSYWELKTWDKFCIPKPFSRIDYYIHEPLFLPKDMEIDEAKKILQEYMSRVDAL